MTFSKTQIISAAALFAGFGAVGAQGNGDLFISSTGQNLSAAKAFEFIFRADARYRQSPTTVNFESGQHLISLRDGQVLYEGLCASTAYVPPNTGGYPFYFGGIVITPCAPGTNGFVSSGDFNNDGVDDPAAYLGITTINRAAVVEAKRPDKVVLVAAPPSELPRPSAGFTAQGALVFYNIQTTQIFQYPLAQYFYNRVFTAAERQTFDDQIVEGAYRYNFPTAGRPTVPVPITVNYFGAVDGFREKNNQKVGFLFQGFTFVGGFARIDPDKPNTIRWQGNTPDKVSTAADQTFFSVRTLAIPGDPLSDPGAGVVFPAFAGPTAARVQLPSPLDTSYTLPPGIIPPGTTGLLEVTLKRNRGAVISDLSETVFSIPVEFMAPGSPGIEALAAIAAKLPPTATSVEKSYDHDFDGDGLSNFAEWVFDSNPADAGSIPIAPRLGFEQPEIPEGTISTRTDGAAGNWVFRVSKKKNTIPALKYSIENSIDMNAWSQVTSADVNWQLVETEDEIKVVSRSSELSGGSFFRVVVEEKK